MPPFLQTAQVAEAGSRFHASLLLRALRVAAWAPPGCKKGSPFLPG